MTDKRTPFNKPFIVGKELFYIAKAVMNGSISGDGEYTRLCQKWLEHHLHTPKALLTHSCTAALEMAAILANIQPGDEVIMPSFTFVSTANAFVLRGATPVFVDIRPDTLNIDENEVERAVTRRTKAVVAVHYAGQPCAMAALKDICKNHGLILIEDAAQAILARDNNREALGTIGDLGCLSFHETKNVIAGEGGALLINNKNLIERAEIIWQKGTNRKSFLRGQINKYTWVDLGSSFLPNELTAAFLYAQLEHAQRINTHRKSLYNKYIDTLSPLAIDGLIQLPEPRKNDVANAHIFYLLTRHTSERSELISHLDKQLVSAVFHYIPLHTSPAGKKYGRAVGSLPVTLDISDRLLRLPMYFEMSSNDIKKVCSLIKDFYQSQEFLK